MAFTLALAQCGAPADDDVLAQVESYAAEAEQAGAQLLVFPEALMFPHRLSADELREAAEPLDGPFAQGVAASAARHGLWIAFTLYETNVEGRRPFNTAVVVDDEGAIRACYRKCHLYDAHGECESDRTDKGDAFCPPVVTPFCTLGLGICYDLRFPEHARAAAIAGCNLIVYPAAWYDGPHKREHWETLLRARAIENECFVAGVCRAGEEYVGASLVAGPLGEVLAQGPKSTHQALVTSTVDLTKVAGARDRMPIFAHRRPDLYS